LSDRVGSVDEAVLFYLDAQELDKQAPALHEQAGLDYIRLKNFNKAAAEFEKVVGLAPEDTYARYVLALLYVQLNDFKNAAGQYASLLEKNLEDRNQNLGLRRILSQLYFLDEDFDAARRESKEILKLAPVDEWGLYMIAMIDSQQGRAQEAMAGFKEVLLHYPDNSEAMNALAYMYAEQSIELDQALALAEKALALDPANAAYLDTAGWIYFKLGDIDRALEFLKKAHKLMLDPVISGHLKEAEEASKSLKKQ
jgi:tetratricopeptide (TPR) repeat protein